MKRSEPHSFLREQRGMTGAEKALLICFALAIIVIGGALVSRGSDRAARDAERTLGEGLGAGGKLGDVVRPLQTAGAPEAPGPGKDTSTLVSFSSDFKEPQPRGAPESAPPMPSTSREIVVARGGGDITAVAIQRTGLIPRTDPVLQVLRDALGNQDIDPSALNGTVTVWRRAEGSTATMDARGNVFIVDGDRRVVLFGAGGGLQVATPDANAHFDGQGRLRSYGLLGRRGTTTFLAGSYEFDYGPDGQPSRVRVLGGPHAGTWTRGPDGQWTNERGQRWTGGDGPSTWPQVLAGRDRLAGISAAAMSAIDDEMSRVRAIWRQYFPDADGLGLRTFRNIVGSGFSGNIAEIQRLSRETTAITGEIAALRALQGRLAGSQDPVEIARLSREFSRRALALRDRIDRFRNDSARVVGQSMRAGRAWAIAKDVYGLGTAGGPVSGLWNLGKLIKDVVGD